MAADDLNDSRSTPTWLLAIASIAFLVSAIFVIDAHGPESFLPEFIAGFGAALGAFVIALTWEADRERRRREHDADLLRKRRGRSEPRT